jgi:sterol desaturase/sphingolipid hydroxylase (fatty acid hydroxylase superfamily)
MAKNFVSDKDESVRLFKSGFMEFFSKVHFSVPLFIYLPVIGYNLYLTNSYSINAFPALGLFVGGIVFWTIPEYTLHRFVFHYHPTSEFGKKIHFMMHGVHHDYPNDSLRLVLPPSVSIPLAVLFYFLFLPVLGGILNAPFYAGFVAGYLYYDIGHYAMHHFKIKNRLWSALKDHHMRHHYVDPDKGFGVSSTIWDQVLGTMFNTAKKEKVSS